MRSVGDDGSWSSPGMTSSAPPLLMVVLDRHRRLLSSVGVTERQRPGVDAPAAAPPGRLVWRLYCDARRFLRPVALPAVVAALCCVTALTAPDECTLSRSSLLMQSVHTELSRSESVKQLMASSTSPFADDNSRLRLLVVTSRCCSSVTSFGAWTLDVF